MCVVIFVLIINVFKDLISYLPHPVHLQHVDFEKLMTLALLLLEFLYHYVVYKFGFLIKHIVNSIKLFTKQTAFSFYPLWQILSNEKKANRLFFKFRIIIKDKCFLITINRYNKLHQKKKNKFISDNTLITYLSI